MTNGIICTTDFSDSSKEALKWSIRLATKLGSRLTILYTYRLFKQNDEIIQAKRKIDEEALRDFSVLEQELLAGSGIEYDFKTEVGFIADRIAEHLKKNKLSFLVISKGMSIRNRETFDDLLAKLKIPLVIVP